ncbi:MAG: heavy-metal-associated domain-containing protein [Planctomycetes bacterium]|nr:heavy-metal-associated domain-containing protein [Planctomycetota bacterium]
MACEGVRDAKVNGQTETATVIAAEDVDPEKLIVALVAAGYGKTRFKTQ